MTVSIIERALDTGDKGHAGPGLDGQDVRNEEEMVRMSFALVPALDKAEVKAPRQLCLDPVRLSQFGIIQSQMPDTGIAEEYRRIKQPLLQKIRTDPSRRKTCFSLIMVTSSIAGEGKTFTALNLAISMAMEKDLTVALVDSDMVTRGLSRLLSLDLEKGLSDLLRDEHTGVAEALIRTNIADLSVLPIGGYDPHYTENIGSSVMRQLIQQLSLQNGKRVIIFDAPSLLVNSAASVLAALMHQIIIVVEVGKTPRDSLQEAMLLLEESKSVGVVLNKSRSSALSKYYAYGQGQSL